MISLKSGNKKTQKNLMTNIWRILKYINYLLNSIHLHGIHSPFVFNLNRSIFQEKIPFYCFEEIESLRAKLQLTHKKIEVIDLGAGSRKNNKNERKISSISKSALKDPKNAQLIFRLIYEFKPQNILEIGTSFGLTTAYMAKANPSAEITSIEGSPQIAKIAKVNYKKLNINNIEVVNAPFDDVLEEIINSKKTLDFVFFDGNHQKKPTIDYFEKCLKKANPDSIFIFDDIYWSREMHAAWNEIQKHPQVSISIDLFQMGILFFKTDQAKEHFTVYH